jgi:hypothetical protein
VVKTAIRNGWLDKDTFIKFTLKKEATHRSTSAKKNYSPLSRKALPLLQRPFLLGRAGADGEQPAARCGRGMVDIHPPHKDNYPVECSSATQSPGYSGQVPEHPLAMI